MNDDHDPSEAPDSEGASPQDSEPLFNSLQDIEPLFDPISALGPGAITDPDIPSDTKQGTRFGQKRDEIE